jgi:hypothetical protein
MPAYSTERTPVDLPGSSAGQAIVGIVEAARIELCSMPSWMTWGPSGGEIGSPFTSGKGITTSAL